MRIVALFCYLMCLPYMAFASWTVSTEADSMSDKIKKKAVTVNNDGFSIYVYRADDDRVWVNFSLPRNSINQLSPERPPIYRIDKEKPNDTADIVKAERALKELAISLKNKELLNSLPLFQWEPKWVNYMVWNGVEKDGRNVQINQLMRGKQVVFRYFLFTGGYKETSFLLDGADSAIASAIGIAITEDSEVLAKAAVRREATDAFVTASKACSEKARLEPPHMMGITASNCLQKVNACKQKSGDDAGVFRQCIQ